MVQQSVSQRVGRALPEKIAGIQKKFTALLFSGECDNLLVWLPKKKTGK